MRAMQIGWASAAIAVLTTGTAAFGQEQQGENPPEQPYNFAHPPGTETAPLGSLGHVEKRGHGPIDMVLIPGASFGWSVWEGFMERNADRYSMYAITPAGYDGTQPPPWPDDAENFVEQVWTDALLDGVVDLVKREGLDRPVVVGHHLMGDHYALRLGLAHPELFRGAVVVAGAPARIMTQQQQTDAGARLMTPVEEQRAAVKEQWIPFFRNVTRERWLQGSYSADTFTSNAERGAALFEEQISTPIPTQLRYYLEFLMTNIAPQLSSLDIPLLAIDPERDPELLIQQSVTATARQLGGDEEAARERVMQMIEQRFGSYEEFAAQIRKSQVWEALRQEIPQFQLEYVADSRIFVMEDQAEKLDQLIADFAATFEDGAS